VKITRGLHNAEPAGGCVLTIGNFDGVHRGHQALLERLAALAASLRLPAVMLTFEPHPVELLAPQRAPARLTRFREKMDVLAGQPLDRVVCARFDRAFAATSARGFIDDVLCARLGVRHLLIGDDFRFGCGGEGNFETLLVAARAGRFALTRVDTVRHDGARVSSTRVRELLACGEFGAAAQLLGRPYTLCGRVAPGQRIGRSIGFPTANIALRRNASPLSGVYAVTAHDGAGTALRAVANVGRRPTLGGSEARLEVHVLDFDGDLYGRELRVRFHRRLRPEQRFAGLDELKAQIARDVSAARAVHAALADAADGGAAGG
jgi:riboflavin kinase/FMN adenylyltransferase